MSHFSQVKTELINRRFLEKALTNMGLAIQKEDCRTHVRGFLGDTVEAEFKVDVGSNYDIGFRKGESGYEVVGDWEILPRLVGMRQEDFLKKLKREYAKAAVMELAKEKGFEIQCAENEENETIEMVVTQW